jgi:glycosyltransferase involved in cell wall biosynthesis
MMKVLHVETGMNLYGGALQVLYLIGGLSKREVTNVLACPAESRIGAEAVGICDRVRFIPFSGELDLLFIRRLMRVIKAERPDIVHLHSRRGADTLGGVAASLSGVKTVLSRRVDNPEHPLLARTKYRLYDRVVTISNAIRDVLASEGVPPEKITCVHSAVDIGAYGTACDREWFAKEFDLEPGTRTVGMAAQFIERKGHRRLIQAVPGILESFPETIFLLFGKGPLEDEMKALCQSVDVSGSVRFPGFRDDLQRIYPCLDLLAHPADMEGLGVSLLQAAASAVPIVATRAGGLPEVVRHGMNGLLVAPRDPGTVAEAVKTLLADPARARSMGEAGRAIVEGEFSIDAMVSGNLRVYRELLG